MRTRNIVATSFLALAIFVACLGNSASAQNPQNLVTGLGPVVSNFGWQNWTAMNRISGSSLLASSPSTRLYLGFTGGTEADINNMVIYTTARGLPVITAVTPVTLNSSSSPTISLADACPGRSIGPNAPCIVALDTLQLALSPLNDYYFVVYFTDDSNNNLLGVAKQAFPTSSMTGSDVVGDRSRLNVGDFIPRGNNTGVPHLLMYVMNQ
jgi:hypothetical protein